MLTLRYDRWTFDAKLQIVHADVRLAIDGDVLIDEPLCVDVGLPALLYSRTHDTAPDRWAEPGEWRRMPFWVCGCGDPECRAHSYAARHRRPEADQAGGAHTVELIEVEERQGEVTRELTAYSVAADEYYAQVSAIGHSFLQFVAALDYRPLFPETEAIVRRLLGEA